MEKLKNNKQINKLLVGVIVVISFLCIWFITKTINLKINNKNPYDQITIFYGNLMVFDDNEENSLYEISVNEEQLIELQNILENYDLESEKYRIEDNGHYHGLTYYSSILITPTMYKVKFNDESEMLISDYDYELQYKKGKNYYLITDGKVVAQKIFEIVDEFIHREPVNITTEKITISGITSGNSLNITESDTISKILNEFRYVKDEITKDTYDKLIKLEKEDYDKGREYPRELEYKVNFNNGTIINIILRNSSVGYITNENNDFIEGIHINSKFIFMIHNIFTDYYKEKNKLFDAEEIYLLHNNIEKKIDDVQKTEIINKLSMTEIDNEKVKEKINISKEDYVITINNNKIILNKNNLYIIYENGNTNCIRSLELENYIKNLM